MSRDEVEKKIKEYTDIIVAKFDPEKIILFGSYAWGNPGPDSDVDLLVVKETENTRILAREISSSLRPRSTALDLLVFRPQYVSRGLDAGDFFVSDIMSKGRLLYAK